MNQFNAHPLPKKILIVSLCFATLTQVTCVFSTTKTHLENHQVLTTQEVALNPANLSAIDSIVQSEIDAKHIPGAAIVIGQNNHIVYRRAFGSRTVKPTKDPMTIDTIFDLASLTKVLVTTTAIMQLTEQGKLNLDEPAAKYWPVFSVNGKDSITLRMLMTHSSGLPVGIDIRRSRNPTQILQQLASVKPVRAAGQGTLYSDINFAVLGEIVSRVSGLSLKDYATRNIFNPLHMQDTGFTPNHNALFNRNKRARIAPTTARRGETHDPLARALEGIAGNAGVFSTADDLALFAQALLNDGASILSRASVHEMFSPQTSPSYDARGLGWRLSPVLASNRAALPSLGAASHLGYTGTGLWLDPVRHIFIIILSNRVVMPNEGDADPLRAKVVNTVSQALGPLSAQEIIKARPELASVISPYIIHPAEREVLAGIDVLAADKFSLIAYKRIGLLTHRSAVDHQGQRTIDVLFHAPHVSLVRLFSPEHGLQANQEGKINNSYDSLTGLPIISLYGEQNRPTREMLQGLDAVLVDLQDVGVRFFTYASTVAYLLETAAAANIPVIILDRPNPINADSIQGPVLDAKLRSFTGYWSIPIRHGMTLGELAQLFVGEAQISAKLFVVPLKHYFRSNYYDQTGLAFIPPSPNLYHLTSITLYPGVGMIEGANISVGRGTGTPFMLVGAPWINSTQLSASLNNLALAGVHFKPAEFIPAAAPYAGQGCHGVHIYVTDRQQLNTPVLGLALAYTLWQLHPNIFSLNATLHSIGSQAVLDAIYAGLPFEQIVHTSENSLRDFKKIRKHYLLYK